MLRCSIEIEYVSWTSPLLLLLLAAGSSSGSGGCSHKIDPNEADEVIEGILRPIVQLPEVKLAPVSSVYTRVPLANYRHFVR